MKTIKLLVVAFVTLSSFPILAQQVDATAQQNSTTTVSGTHVDDSAKAGANAQAGQGGARVNGARSASASGSTNGPAKGMASANDSQRDSAAAATNMRPVNCELVGKLDSKTAKAGRPGGAEDQRGDEDGRWNNDPQRDAAGGTRN